MPLAPLARCGGPSVAAGRATSSRRCDSYQSIVGSSMWFQRELVEDEERGQPRELVERRRRGSTWCRTRPATTASNGPRFVELLERDRRIERTVRRAGSIASTS